MGFAREAQLFSSKIITMPTHQQGACGICLKLLDDQLCLDQSFQIGRPRGQRCRKCEPFVQDRDTAADEQDIAQLVGAHRGRPREDDGREV
jgi:hypothetical protein